MTLSAPWFDSTALVTCPCFSSFLGCLGRLRASVPARSDPLGIGHATKTRVIRRSFDVHSPRLDSASRDNEGYREGCQCNEH
jgi:hypothetical protein